MSPHPITSAEYTTAEGSALMLCPTQALQLAGEYMGPVGVLCAEHGGALALEDLDVLESLLMRSPDIPPAIAELAKSGLATCSRPLAYIIPFLIATRGHALGS